MNISTSFILAAAISGKFRIGAGIVLVASILLFLAAIVRDCGVNRPRPLKWLEKLLYIGIVVGALGLALTGLGMVIGFGQHLEGWGLMAHCAVAPIFAIGLAGFALCASDRFVPNCGACGDSNSSGDTGACCKSSCNCCTLAVGFFWLALIAGLVLMLSAALPMLPIFDTHGLELALKVHRYSGLAFVALIIPHAARVLRGS